MNYCRDRHNLSEILIGSNWYRRIDCFSLLMCTCDYREQTMKQDLIGRESDFPLESCQLTQSLLTITFSDGNTLKLVREKYERYVAAVMAQAQVLTGKHIIVITSQTTANWSTMQYFCAIRPLPRLAL